MRNLDNYLELLTSDTSLKILIRNVANAIIETSRLVHKFSGVENRYEGHVNATGDSQTALDRIVNAECV